MIAITGASGFLGSRTARALEKHGAAIRLLGRQSSFPFDLSRVGEGACADRSVLIAHLRGTQTLIHSAWDLSTRPLEARRKINTHGSIALFEAAKEAGVRRIVFFSSTLAHEESRSQYGQAKHDVERELGKIFPDSLSLRIGLVIRERGQTLPFDRAVKMMPVFPWIGSGSELTYVISETAFVSAVTRSVLGDDRGTSYVMEREPLTPRELLARVTKSRLRPVITFPRFIADGAWKALGLDPQKLDSLIDLQRIDIESGARVLP